MLQGHLGKIKPRGEFANGEKNGVGVVSITVTHFDLHGCHLERPFALYYPQLAHESRISPIDINQVGGGDAIGWVWERGWWRGGDEWGL